MSNRKKRARAIRQIGFLVVLFAAVVYGVHRYYRSKEEARVVGARFITEGAPANRPLQLETAATSQARRIGLRYRRTLADGRGLIFIYPDSAAHQQSLQDVYVSLDLLFLDPELRVVHVIAATPINSQEEHGADVPSKYIVALKAGEAAKQGIKQGTRLELTGGKRLPQAS